MKIIFLFYFLKINFDINKSKNIKKLISINNFFKKKNNKTQFLQKKIKNKINGP
jgi:hypothetical protein